MIRISPKQQTRQRALRELTIRLVGERGGVCEDCHQSPDWRGLAPHHKIKRSQGGRDTEDNIIILCGRCHSLRHGIKET
jgi:5-methylcytosine-specific restriction endonuclease McrA